MVAAKFQRKYKNRLCECVRLCSLYQTELSVLFCHQIHFKFFTNQSSPVGSSITCITLFLQVCFLSVCEFRSPFVVLPFGHTSWNHLVARVTHECSPVDKCHVMFIGILLIKVPDLHLQREEEVSLIHNLLLCLSCNIYNNCSIKRTLA